MNLVSRKFTILITFLCALLILSGCNNTSNEPAPDNDRNGEQQQPADQPDNSMIMEEFETLSEGNADVQQLVVFIRSHREQVTKEQLTSMLDALEEKQHEQGIELESRYFEEEGIQDKLIDWYGDGKNVKKPEAVEDEALKKLLQDTEAGWYKVETTEGMFFPVIDYERYREFQPGVTEDMKAYIDIMAVESNVASVKDAGLAISWDEVIQRALSMEKFMQDHPQSNKLEEITRLFSGYKYITFQGIDNAPLFSYENGLLLPKVKNAYQAAVDKGIEDTEYLATMKQFLELVRQNGDKQTDAVKSFQDKVTEGALEEYEE